MWKVVGVGLWSILIALFVIHVVIHLGVYIIKAIAVALLALLLIGIITVVAFLSRIFKKEP